MKISWLAKIMFSSTLLAGLLAGTPSAFAATNLLNNLAGTWDDLDSFVTLGQCAGAPSNAEMYLCSPAQLANAKVGRFEGGGFVEATDSVLTIADTLRKQEVSADDIKKLFSSYNYSEFLISGRVSYSAPGLILGVRPVRLAGEFQVHNPNLPLASLSYRSDLEFFVGAAYKLEVGPVSVAVGGEATFVRRHQILAEASLVDFASKPATSLLDSRYLNGVFFDAAALLEMHDAFALSAFMRDMGGYFSGTDSSANYLFILPDHQQRFFLSAHALPRVWVGNLQLGVEVIGYLNSPNSWPDQLFGTAGFYVGPLRILSGFRPELFRTGLALRFSNLEIAVAQEWVNKLETGRSAQPRFTVGVTASL